MMLGKNQLFYSLAAVGLLSAAILFAQQQADVPSGKMIRPRLLIHVVGNLEKSVAFYHEGLDLQTVVGPGPLTDSTLMSKALSVNSAAKAQAATLAVPGSNVQLQLIQFSGTSGKLLTQHLYDPGVTRFSTQVRDIDKAFNQIKDRGITIPTISAGPVFPERPRDQTRAVMMQDPDGFVFELSQRGTPVKTDVPESSNIYNAGFSLTTDNIEKSLRFYRDILGFTVDGEPHSLNEAVLGLEGTPRAHGRSVLSHLKHRTISGSFTILAISIVCGILPTSRILARPRSRLRFQI